MTATRGIAIVLAMITSFAFRPTLAWVVTATMLAACAEDCPREACDRLAEPANASIPQGIAGVVAYETDVVENGCQECEFASSNLAIWREDALFDDALIAATKLRAAEQNIIVDARYEKELVPGNYLVCTTQASELPSDGDACTTLVVGPGQVVTVNVSLRYGPPGLVVH